MMLLLFTILFQIDTVNLTYSRHYKYKYIKQDILTDNFSLSINIDVDSQGTIYVLDHDKNSLKSYTAKLLLKDSINNELNYTFSTSVHVIDSTHIMLIGNENLILDSNLNIIKKIQFPENDKLYHLYRQPDIQNILLKKSRYRRDFYSLNLNSQFELVETTKINYKFTQNDHFTYINGFSIVQNKFIQTFDNHYLLETIDKQNNRTLYTRKFSRVKIGERKNIVFLVKGIGVVQSEYATENTNKVFKDKFKDDILDLMGVHHNLVYLRTANNNPNRLDFDLVDTGSKTYRHFYMNFNESVYNSIVRNNKLIVITRNENRCKVIFHNIQKL